VHQAPEQGNASAFGHGYLGFFSARGPRANLGDAMVDECQADGRENGP
jgi:hypothetical protein